MKLDFKIDLLQKAIKHRNYAIVVSAVLLLSNILLCLKVLFIEERWVLMPQFDVQEKLVVQGERYSDDYLQNWAGGLATTVLTVNPNNVDKVAEKFLEISSTRYGNIKSTLDHHAKDIKSNQVSTAFYPKDFTIDQEKKIISVTGTFYTWFGREKVPVVDTKTYLIGWMIGPKGVLLATQFEERKTDE